MTGQPEDADRASFRDEGEGRDRRSQVVAVQRVTPHLVRITLEDDLDDFCDNGGDQHVTVNFYPDDAIVPFPLPRELAREMHRYLRPRMRRYTIRQLSVDERGRRRVDLDAVVHPDGGPGTRWAEHVTIGDPVWWWGPTEGWCPRPATTTLLLVGDETAFPAVEALLRETADRLDVVALVEASSSADLTYFDEVVRPHGPRSRVLRVPRSGPLGDGSPELMSALAAAAADLGVGPGATDEVQVWGAGERATVRALRRFCHDKLGMSRQDAFLVSYWTHGEPQDSGYERRNDVEVARNRLARPEQARRFVRGL